MIKHFLKSMNNRQRIFTFVNTLAASIGSGPGGLVGDRQMIELNCKGTNVRLSGRNSGETIMLNIYIDGNYMGSSDHPSIVKGTAGKLMRDVMLTLTIYNVRI